jgi:hypothetical protein
MRVDDEEELREEFPRRREPADPAARPPPGRIRLLGARGGAAAASPTSRAQSLDSRVASLAAALRRARMESAEQSGSFSDLRAAEIARLEILKDALAPVLAQIPADCDLFDAAISPGERPRLFIDHLGFVEMSGDRRCYRFQQDTRHGRIVICESDKLDVVVEAATGYIAHRLLEREKALASDYRSGGAASAFAARAAAQGAQQRAALTPQAPATPAPGAGLRRTAMNVFLFIVEFFGSVAFFGLTGLLLVWAWRQYGGR